MLAMAAGAAPVRAPRVTPVTISRATARRPVQVLSIRISLQGGTPKASLGRGIAIRESFYALCNISHK